MMTKMRSILALLILTTALFSCAEKPAFEKVYSFNNNEWKQEQMPMFKVPIDDTTATYRFVLTVRTTSSYAHSNMWLFWHTKTPSSIEVREPFELKIANPDGSWIGKNSGTIVENTLTFADRKIDEKGTYVFTIEQAVTEASIKNVLDLGLSVYKVKK